MNEAPEDHLASLLADSITGRLTESRRQELWDWGQSDPVVYRLIKDFEDWDYVIRELATWKRIDPQKAFRRWRRRRLVKKVRNVALTATAVLIGGLAWWRITEPSPAASNSVALVVRKFEEKALSVEGNNDSTKVHILPDGSKVWLNSKSTLYYPARFTGGQRVVELSGEAFFEPSKAQAPFIVRAGKTRVEVMGTRFNVADYEGDSIEVTLIQGKVKVLNGEDSVVLKQGQQVEVARNGTELSAPREVVGMDVAEWKNNRFYFPPHSSTLSVLRRIARWYDLDLDIHGEIPDQLEYDGDMQRSLKLEEVLRLLPFQGIKFERVGRRLIVEPKI